MTLGQVLNPRTSRPPADIVKLDRGLIAGLARGRDLSPGKCHRKSLRGYGGKVVAEGVENAQELFAAVDSGAHYGQVEPARPAPEPPEPSGRADQNVDVMPTPTSQTYPPKL